MKERDYQIYAVNSLWHYFTSGKGGNPLILMPTGTGKSVVIASAIRRAFAEWNSTRVMNLTHVKELVEQNYKKLLTMWPTAPAGIFSSGLNRKDTQYPITFGGVASVIGNEQSFGHIDLLFIDEAHMVSLDEEAMYNQIIAELKKANPKLVVIGLTATGFRNGQGMLTEGEKALFNDICCDMTGRAAFNWFIDQGYLVTLLPASTKTQLDVDKVQMLGDDYNQGQLQKAVDKQETTLAVVREAVARATADNRKHWLCFAAGVKHTENVAGMFEYFGVTATFVHSKMKAKLRDQRIADYKAGKYQVMVNNGILTTGFDFPELDCIIMLRPTKSVGLWIQMLGRGTRPFYADGFDLDTMEGRLDAIKYSQKPNTLVLDFARNTEKLGPINDPTIPKKKGDKVGVAPVRICPECGMYNHASATSCFNCGTEFPRQLAIAPTVSTKPLIARDEKPVVEKIKVDRVTYNIHFKDGRPPSIQVTYFCGLMQHREWVCLEHGGFPAKRSRDWWRERANCDYDEVPETTAKALEEIDALRIPLYLNVWVNKKPTEIMGYEYR